MKQVVLRTVSLTWDLEQTGTGGLKYATNSWNLRPVFAAVKLQNLNNPEVVSEVAVK